MSNESKDTKIDHWVNWIKNNQILSIILFLCILIISLAQFTNALEDIKKFVDSLTNTSKEIVNGKWYLVRNDELTKPSIAQSQRVMTTWEAHLSSNNGIIEGKLVNQIKNFSLGKISTTKIDGVVSGILRVDLLSLAYGSRDTK